MWGQKQGLPAIIRVLIIVIVIGLLVPLLLSVAPTRWHRIEVERDGIVIPAVWERYGRQGYVVSFEMRNRLDSRARVRLAVGMESFVDSIEDPEVRLTEVIAARGSKRVRVPVWKPERLQYTRRPLMRDPSVRILAVEREPR